MMFWNVMMNVKQQTFYQRFGRSSRLSNKDVQALVKSVNNKIEISQRRLARQFGVHQSTISRTFKNKTTVKTHTRKSASKYKNWKSKKACYWELHKILKVHIQLILEDEKYFSLTGDIACHRKYYITDSFIASNIKQKWNFNQSCLSEWQYLKRVFHRFPFIIQQKIYTPRKK